MYVLSLAILINPLKYSYNSDKSKRVVRKIYEKIK